MQIMSHSYFKNKELERGFSLIKRMQKKRIYISLSAI